MVAAKCSGSNGPPAAADGDFSSSSRLTVVPLCRTNDDNSGEGLPKGYPAAIMLVFLIHVRDPQFNDITDKTRFTNGHIRVMVFPPIGIMSLSSVLKRAGHECMMFDQANPDTPNDTIIEEIKRCRPALIGLSFLSTTSYPYAKILARQIRATNPEVKLAFGGVFVSLNASLVKLQCSEVDFVCRGDGEQLVLDLLDRLDDPHDVGGLTWTKDGQVVTNPNRTMERHLAQCLFPAMAKAHCRTIMVGIESGSQKILDRLKKEQTLAEVNTAVMNAKRAGIEIVHGFFTIGNPDETVEDMQATFDFASRLPLDTFGFNRLCVYRGTPLWQEYVKRGLVSERDDWYKDFKCSAIDPTCLSGEIINDERRAGLRRLFLYKLLHYPAQTYRLLRRFLRYMPVRDVVYLITKPFLGKGQGATKAEVLSRAVEHGQMKDAAAQLTQMTDDMLDHVLQESRAERLRI